MGGITDKAADVYRNSVVAGVPASGANEPRKADIRELFSTIDGGITQLAAAFVSNGAAGVYAVKSAMDGNLSPGAGALAIVYNDGANNGIFVKSGASGQGSWLPTGLMLRGQTGEPGEIGPQGLSFYQVALQTGYVPYGTTEAAFIDAVVADIATEATATAVAAADRAQAYANNLSDFVQGSPGASATEVGLFPAAKLMTFEAGINRIRTTGRQLRGDGGAAWYVRWVAPMAALTAAQQDYSWFEAADGSRWVLEENQVFTAAMFGALGGNQIDAGPIINAALQAPMVKTLNLGPLTHWYHGSIQKPPGKFLVGITPAQTWLMPRTYAERSTNRGQRVQADADTGGGFANFSINVQRSGLGMGDANRSSGLTVSANTGNVTGCTVDRVDVYNATGYAHYESTSNGYKLRGVLRRNCRAFNSQVCFESTEDSEVETIDCYANVDAANVWDGGTLIPCETIFHEYGAIKRVRRLRCFGYGQAGAGAHPITTTADIGTVIYEACDIEITNAVPAMQAVGQSGFVIRDLQIINSRFVSANAGGAGLTNTRATIRGGLFIGGNSASNGAGDGAGIDVSVGAEVDIFGAEIIGNSNPAGGGAAFGLNQQAGIVRVHGGGRITANGPDGLRNPIGGTVTMVTTPVLTPDGGASGGTYLPAYRQRVRGEKLRSTWGSFNPVTGNNHYFVNIDLPTAVASRDLTDVVLTLRGPDGDLTFAQAPLSINWQSDATIQVQIASPIDLPNFAVRYSIIEWLA